MTMALLITKIMFCSDISLYAIVSVLTDGNGFKTSTMRLGADVIVFSRCEGKYGGRAMQSIGLLSFTFLRSTGKEDIVVPMVCITFIFICCIYALFMILKTCFT